MDKVKILEVQLKTLREKKENLERNIRLLELKLERLTLTAKEAKPTNVEKKKSKR